MTIKNITMAKKKRLKKKKRASRSTNKRAAMKSLRKLIKTERHV